VAVDWVTKNLYWADGLHGIIGVRPLEGVNHQLWKAIVDTNLSAPQYVAINPLRQ